MPVMRDRPVANDETERDLRMIMAIRTTPVAFESCGARRIKGHSLRGESFALAGSELFEILAGTPESFIESLRFE